jgi:hypothetical protein
MFCDQCGTQLQAGQQSCGRCGKTVIGLIELRRSRVREHVRLVGILWMAYSALHAVGGVALIIVAQVIFGQAFHISNGGPPPEVSVWLRPLLTVIGWLLLAKSAAGFFAGWGLLQREDWARTIALVVGFVALLNVPLGTALGVYTLWVLLPRQSDDEYKALAQAA